ncbi:unnamed protein product, partial [marine sediment metagenome]
MGKRSPLADSEQSAAQVARHEGEYFLGRYSKLQELDERGEVTVPAGIAQGPWVGEGLVGLGPTEVSGEVEYAPVPISPFLGGRSDEGRPEKGTEQRWASVSPRHRQVGGGCFAHGVLSQSASGEGQCA